MFECVYFTLVVWGFDKTAAKVLSEMSNPYTEEAVGHTEISEEVNYTVYHMGIGKRGGKTYRDKYIKI